jgi:DNA-directed RNA polymerase specialized sigma24 family protein
MQGLSTREVAHAMGLSEQTVKQRLSRARRALQAALTEARP